ncbi:MAG: PepSY domain-containing protein [Calothrix sp. SM1_7_51]|nr:PepSY domain-containing protein [Calothrix sp. SM1_7_51]
MGRTYFAWTYPLHIGTYGGIYTRILYIILGLVPAFLFITGFVIFVIKPTG